MKNTPTVRAIGHKENNDTSGAYPFPNWKSPTRFRRVPSIAFQVKSPPCFKILCSIRPNQFPSNNISVEVAMDGENFTKDKAVMVYKEDGNIATSNLIKTLSNLLKSLLFLGLGACPRNVFVK